METTDVKANATAFFLGRPNRLAKEERARLFEGLERIINAADSPEACSDLALAAPSFWPIDTVGGTKPIRWDPAAWPLFIAFRNYLRKLWVGDVIKDGTDHVFLDGVYLNYLLGLDIKFASYEPGQYIDAILPNRAFTDAWDALKQKYPEAFVSTSAIVVPCWAGGQLTYVSANDFQKALYELLPESWRAKVCRLCTRYFIADKNAQAYCSTDCSGGNKRIRGRTYWRDKGAPRRAEKKQARKRNK